MKRALLTLFSLLLIIAAAIAQNARAQGADTKPFVPLHTYFVSPTGDDARDGKTPATAWKTIGPHAVACGDVILAQPGIYTNGFSHSGPVSSCPSTSGGIDGAGGIWVATLLCAGSSVGDCLVSSKTAGCAPNAPACGLGNINITTSNWAIEGFASTTNGASPRSYVADACFSRSTILHHIAFINNVAYNTGQGYSINDCGYNSGTPGNGVDYWAVVGSIAANASQDVICLAAIDYVGPANSDNNPGTHTYLAGNWSYDNRYGSACRYDGEGMMLDTLDAHGYKGQIVVRDNIIYRSGRYGLQLFFQNKSQGAATIYIYQNTLYGNMAQPGNIGGGPQGEINYQSNGSGGASPWIVTIHSNIAQSTWKTQAGEAGYARILPLVLGTSSKPPGLTIGGTGIENVLKGLNTGTCLPWTCEPSGGVVNTYTNYLGTNLYIDPAFKNAAHAISNYMGVPNCKGYATVTACMGWDGVSVRPQSIIDDLTPTAAPAIGKGYQPPKPCGPDPLYPKWLKGVVHLQASEWAIGAKITQNSGLTSKPCDM